MSKKEPAFASLVDAKDNRAYCHEMSCWSCPIKSRCRHTATLEIDVDPDYDSGPTSFKVVVEPYRHTASKWVLFKTLRDNYDHHGGYGSQLEYMGYDDKHFAWFCRGCRYQNMRPATRDEQFAADNNFSGVIDARKDINRGAPVTPVMNVW